MFFLGNIHFHIPNRSKGVLIAYESGLTSAYGLHNAQARGTLFVNPVTEVYQGMIVGENRRAGDMEVNVAKKKHITNMRAAGADEALRLEKPRQFSLEQALDYIQEDELLEITPLDIRLRKNAFNFPFSLSVQKGWLVEIPIYTCDKGRPFITL